MIEGISICIGFVFYYLLEVKGHIIWTSFAILPVVICSYVFFLANWISNDYFVYDPKNAPKEVEITKVVDAN